MGTVAAIPIEDALLEALRRQEFRPVELLKWLANQGYTDSEIKQAVSEMLHEHQIQLTSNRVLKLSPTHAV